MDPQPPAVPQAITAPPPVPPHIHWYGPCQKVAFGDYLIMRCVYPGCRSTQRC